jgi:hypothetical protein
VASAIAMRRAVCRVLGYLGAAGISARPGDSVHIIIDGLPLPELGYPHQALIDGDAHAPRSPPRRWSRKRCAIS